MKTKEKKDHFQKPYLQKKNMQVKLTKKP